MLCHERVVGYSCRLHRSMSLWLLEVRRISDEQRFNCNVSLVAKVSFQATEASMWCRKLIEIDVNWTMRVWVRSYYVS